MTPDFTLVPIKIILKKLRTYLNNILDVIVPINHFLGKNENVPVLLRNDNVSGANARHALGLKPCLADGK